MTKSQHAIQRVIDLSGISQRQIAIKSGISPQAFQKWKNGERTPTLENFIKLCESTGLAIKDVFD